MDTARQIPFRTAALASKLVDQIDLDEAVRSLRRAGKILPIDQPDDPLLAAKLVEQGRLSRYQADQLLAGHSKLNLGSYVIIGFVGQGGMGQVFRARHEFLHREVAIKVLPKSKSTPSAITGFMQEIRVLAQLDHENLVRAFDAGQDGSVYYLVTEFVDGTDLRRLVRSGEPLGMRQAAAIISQAARGLEHAHQRGLIHRDVKPGNLLVSHDGHTKVSDLGLAGSLDQPDLDTRAGKIVGTADYLAPEQIISPRKVTPTSDIYSLGCTLYYAVTGKVPYPGGTTREKARQHCEGTPFNPNIFNSALSDAFVELIADMMHKDPLQRIGTAREVFQRLKPWLEESDSADFERLPPPVLLRGLTDSAPELSDTEDSFPEFAEPAAPPHHSPSQLSQGTAPLSAADQETLPPPVVTPPPFPTPPPLPREIRRRQKRSWLGRILDSWPNRRRDG